MTSSPTAPTARKAEAGRRRTLRVGTRSTSGDGFTLVEVVCVLAIIALLAAILLPAMPRGTSRARLEAYAIEIAALLRADRNAAIRRHAQAVVRVDAADRTVLSGTSARAVRVARDVAFGALLAERCNDRPAFSSISFFSSGMSCGGTIVLTRPGASFEIRVNWLTGGIEIVPGATL
jgi:general secretion pathway protein H